MKTIVVGADGFVGQNLSHRGNLSFYCFDNGFLHRRLGRKTQFADITRDLTKLEECMNSCAGSFKLVNLAAIHHIPYCNQHPDEALLVNVYGNMKLFELAAKYGCKHYLFASSGAVYRPGENKHAECDQRQSSDVYSATKILAEDYLSVASLSYKLPVTSLRFFNIVGAYDITPHLVPDIVDQIMSASKKIRLGNLTTVRDYISVEDICEVIETIISMKADKLYTVLNVGTGEGYTGHQILNIIRDLTGSDKALVNDPNRFRVSDRPSQISNPEKLCKLYKRTHFESVTKSLSAYLAWRGLIK